MFVDCLMETIFHFEMPRSVGPRCDARQISVSALESARMGRYERPRRGHGSSTCRHRGVSTDGRVLDWFLRDRHRFGSHIHVHVQQGGNDGRRTHIRPANPCVCWRSCLFKSGPKISPATSIAVVERFGVSSTPFAPQVVSPWNETFRVKACRGGFGLNAHRRLYQRGIGTCSAWRCRPYRRHLLAG